MLYSEQTKLGNIEIEARIISSIVRRSLLVIGDHIMLSGSSGRLNKSAQKHASGDESFIEMEMAGEGIDIKIYIIHRFGKSIEKTAKDIDRQIRGDIAEYSGFHVAKLTIVFVGIKSRNLSKRHIEVTTYGE